MNKPYVKQYNSNGEVTNPITKKEPYLHSHLNNQIRRKITRGKYEVLTETITDKLTGEKSTVFKGFGNRLNGNNRKNTCKRGKSSRLQRRSN